MICVKLMLQYKKTRVKLGIVIIVARVLTSRRYSPSWVSKCRLVVAAFLTYVRIFLLLTSF